MSPPTILKSSTQVEVPRSELNIAVYIYRSEFFEIPFGYNHAMSYLMLFLVCFYSVVCTAVLPSGTSVLAKKKIKKTNDAPLTVINACVP